MEPERRLRSWRARTAWGVQESSPGSDYTPEEIEFAFAMDKYKRIHGRPYPTWREVLAVLKSLGWSKPPNG